MSETIAAISTAPGEGGIGIVRISGPESLFVMRKLMLGCPETVKPRYAYFGKVVKDASDDLKKSHIIDEAIFIYMKSPHSYTGEDMLEIQAHGSNVVLKNILAAFIDSGARYIRLAEPGEFTKLAFLNGKMDLSQAESVIDIIKARTDLSLEIAEGQKSGRISNAVLKIREKLVDILALMAVNIDYPDEDEENKGELVYSDIIDDLDRVRSDIDKLVDSAAIGKIAREGIRITIAGKPNAGKSTLMNAILGEGRVIVTDIPGTTRDVVEESAVIGGIPVVIADTAGLRETEDIVEKIGIDKTIESINDSDMLIIVVDGSRDIDDMFISEADILSRYDNSRIIVVLNKEDLGLAVSTETIINKIPGSTVIVTSLIGDEVIDAVDRISDAIVKIIDFSYSSVREMNIVTNQRQLNLLKSSSDNICEALNMIKEGEPLEVAELSVNYAYRDLGSIIGEEAGEEVLDRVFSKFCLGK